MRRKRNPRWDREVKIETEKSREKQRHKGRDSSRNHGIKREIISNKELKKADNQNKN